jgi:hypothetical protein
VLLVHGNTDGAVRRLWVLDQLAQVPGGHLVGLAAAVDVEQARIWQQVHCAPRERAGYDLAVQPKRPELREPLAHVGPARVEDGFEE